MTKEELKKAALEYHSRGGVPGKISVCSSKPCETAEDLALAYTPGVAQPCMEIHDNPETVWRYTAKGNLVAVVSDGTAVLGLGNIGAEAGLPVMEGKSVLFKRFADIDAIPLCLNHVYNDKGRTDAAKLIAAVECIEPTFGGINLEDIGGPACFEVERELKKRMNIPVFHDDQHGTAIISLAAIINALKMVGKKIEECRFVVNGAGAAGISCSRFYITAGAKHENFVMCDSKGVIRADRGGLTPEKSEFATSRDLHTLADAMKDADIFLGFSVPGCVTPEMIGTMNHDPIIFAMANPVPEIFPDVARNAGAAVVGTGRSDFPNQINNVLGFPGIFRGALDVCATDINEAMKLAAARSLAELASETVPEDVKVKLAEAYPADFKSGMFEPKCPLSRDYVIPKPFDVRVVPRVARKVAEAAMATGVARRRIDDLDAYEQSVRDRVARNR
ncbi:MAG: NAD-dependent malic enzyme [Victivallaceae bacterium]|nr:NAD-dependent malic enzyme [Victivallaceae bacterium]